MPWTGPGLTAALASAEVPPSQHYVGLEAPGARRMRDLLGPDVMGLRVPAPPPAALRGLYASLRPGTMPNVLRHLPARHVAPLLRALSMTHGSVPTDLTVTTLPAAPVIRTTRDPKLRDWADGNPAVPPLTADTLVAPRVAYTIWLGSPMSDRTGSADLLNPRLARQRANLVNWAGTYGAVLDFVLFTDIPRATFDQVRHVSERPADPYLGEVWDMLVLARGDGARSSIHLVNVDELFNSEALAGAHPLFAPELAATVRELFAAYRLEVNHLRRSGPTKASDILRMFVQVFLGGLYLEPDSHVDPYVTPEDLLGQLEAALADRPGAMMAGQSILFGPAGHPLFQHQLGQVRQRYDQTVDQLLGQAHLGHGGLRDTPGRRTGDYAATLRQVFGTDDIVEFDFVNIGMGFTWSSEPPGRGWTASPQRTLQNAKRHVATLIRQLNNRPGVLDLGAIAAAIALEPDPAAVGEGLLGYLARSGFAPLVTRIVDATYGTAVGGREPEVIPIGLPAAAAAYLFIDPDPARASVELGQRVRPGRFIRPLTEDGGATAPGRGTANQDPQPSAPVPANPSDESDRSDASDASDLSDVDSVDWSVGAVDVGPDDIAALRDAAESLAEQIGAGQRVVEASPDTEVYLAAQGMTARQAALDWDRFVATMTLDGRGTGVYTLLDEDSANELADQQGGDIPAVMRLLFGRPATGLRVAGSLRSWSPQALAEAAQTYDFLQDSSGVVKLHPRFLADVVLGGVSFSQLVLQWWNPLAFVDLLEQALVRLAMEDVAELRGEQAEAEGDRVEPVTPEETDPPARIDGRPLAPAAPVDLMAIRFATEAALFEKRLGGFLLRQPDVQRQIEVIVTELWARADDRQRRQFGGDPRDGVPGAVGTELGLVRRVVESGNPRERLALFFYAMHNYVVGDLLGVNVDKSALLEAEQHQRRPMPAEYGVKVPLPDEVDPPLSRAEWMTLYNGRLQWRPASVRFDVPMSESVQRDAQRTGGLISTSTAGSVYLMTRAVYLMQQHWGIEVDYAVLQRLLVGGNIGAGHHTFHEAMRGFKLAADDLRLPPPDGAEDWYVDDWYRYRQLLPENVLRAHVARDGLFPDEHAEQSVDQRPAG